jgi:hypothetical protein
VYVEEHHTITNLHGCMLLMFQQRTNEVMFEMVSNFLIVFCLNWKIHLSCLLPNKAQNMTMHLVSVVTRFQESMHDDCSFFRIWCGAHQLNLVMEHIVNEVVK